MTWLKRLFCKHDFCWERNLYGDQINYSGGARSIWVCAKCGKVEFRSELHFEGFV